MARIVLRVRLVCSDRLDIAYEEPHTADPDEVVEHVVSTLAEDSGALRADHGGRLVVLYGRGGGRPRGGPPRRGPVLGERSGLEAWWRRRTGTRAAITFPGAPDQRNAATATPIRTSASTATRKAIARCRAPSG